MANVEGGYWRRLIHRLTTDEIVLDAADLSHEVDAVGAIHTCDCRLGQSVTLLGRLRSVELHPGADNAMVEAELYDGTEGVTLVWLGRKHIAGIEPGRTIKASGRVAVREGKKVLYNPYYELQKAS